MSGRIPDGSDLGPDWRRVDVDIVAVSQVIRPTEAEVAAFVLASFEPGVDGAAFDLVALVELVADRR